jgi:hypothetical protein
LAVPEILADTQVAFLGTDRDDVLDRLKRGLEVLHVRPGDTLAPNPNRPPYPGLSAFDTLDAGVYFGRESDVQPYSTASMIWPCSGPSREC